MSNTGGAPRVEVAGEEAQLVAMGARVERLLASIPREHLAGLERVVGADARHLTDKEVRRLEGRRRGRVLATYHPRGGGNAAWIELFADRIESGHRVRPRNLPWLRELFLARVLFHEVGHHISRPVRERRAARERRRGRWRRVLMRHAFSARLRPFRWPLKVLLLAARGLD